MKRYIRILLVALLPLALFSCSEDMETEGGNAGQLMLSYEVAGNVMTRADGSSSSEIHDETEAGWDAPWNENTVSSLCLYVFDASSGNKKEVVTLTDSYKENNAYNLTKACGLTPDNYTSYHLYLVANQPTTVDGSNVSSLDDLKKLNITDFSDYNKKQSTFVMDGKWTGDENAVTSSTDNKTKTINVKLNRALAKVCVKVRLYKESYSDTNPTDLTAFTDFTAKFCNYAKESALIEGGTPNPENANLASSSNTESVISYPSTTSTEASRMVFYSYANDWFDSSKQEKMNEEEPIKTDRQSYILLTYKGHDFKIPVNFRLPKDNDKKWEKLTDDEKNNIKTYYQLSRNHVYNVQVSIVEPKDDQWLYSYTVNDWEDGGTTNFGTKISTTLSRGSYKSSNDATAVMYEALTGNAQPQYSPVITLKVNANCRSVLQTSNTNFQFWTSEGLKDYIEINGNSQDQTVTFALVPKYDIDLANPHDVNATVYLVMPDAYNYKVPFNSGNAKLPGTDSEISYKQVSKSDYDSATSVSGNN